MRFTHLYIDGYGMFHDASLSDLPGGLIVLQGDNEAGKSTLLGFLRALLFGFPRKNAQDYYAPFKSGNHGGRIGVVTADGQPYVIERYAGPHGGPVTITDANGSVHDKDFLPHLLGTATAGLYRNVYAFSLSELQSDSLQDEDVKSAIYGAGMGAAMLTLPNAQKRIESTCDALFKSGGSKPLLNVNLAELERVRTELRQEKQGIAEYDGACAERDRVGNSMDRLQKVLAGARAEQQRVEAYVKLWPQWVELQRLEKDLAALPKEVGGFPDHHSEEMADACSRLRELVRQEEEGKRHLTALEREVDAIEVSEILLDQAHAIERLAEDRAGYVDMLRDAPLKRQQSNSLSEIIRRLLDQLGPDWSEDRATSVDRSLFTRETIAARGRAIGEAESTFTRGEERVSEREEDMDKANRTETEAQHRLEELATPEQTGDPQAIQRLRSDKNQFAGVISDLRTREAERRHNQNRLVAAVKEINSEWTEDDLRTFDGSLAALETVRHFKTLLEDADRQVADSNAHSSAIAHSLEDRRKILARAVAEIEGLPTPESHSRETLKERRTLLRELRKDLSDRKRLADSARHQEERLSDKEREQERATRQPGVAAKAIPLPLMLAAGALLLVGAVVAVVLDNMALGVVLGLFVGADVAYVLVTARSKRAVPGGGGAEYFDAHLQEEIEVVQAELDRLQEQRDAADRAMASRLERLSIPDAPASDELYRLEDEAQEALSELDSREQAEATAERAQGAVTRAEEELEAAQIAHDANTAELGAVREEWGSRLERVRLSATLDPATAERVFDKVSGARDVERSIEDLDRRIHEMESVRSDFRALAEAIPALEQAKDASDTEYLSAVDALLARLDQERQLREERGAAEKLLEGRRKQRAESELSLDKARGGRDEAAKARDERWKSWRAWLVERDLPETLSPETARIAFDTLDACHEQMQKRTAVQTEMERCEKAIAKYEELAQNVFLALARPEPSADSLAAKVSLLSQELQQHGKNREVREVKRRQVEASVAQVEQRAQEIESLKKRKEELLTLAGAQDEEDFRKKAGLCTDHRRLSESIAEREHTVCGIAGVSDLESLRSVLLETDRTQLEGERERLPVVIREMTNELETLRNRRADLGSRIEIMSNTDDLARLRAEEERLLTEIEDAAGIWRRYAVAEWLLKAARSKFEQENQPEVIRSAGAFFQQITGGAYREVFAPIGEDDIEVVAPSDKRKKPDELSRGTVEQLYLALRFGYISHRAKEAEPLPIVMDDILVNFDPSRAQHAAEAILELSKDHQTLYFTCHPATANIFRSLQANTPVYRLDERGFVQNDPTDRPSM